MLESIIASALFGALRRLIFGECSIPAGPDGTLVAIPDEDAEEDAEGGCGAGGIEKEFPLAAMVPLVCIDENVEEKAADEDGVASEEEDNDGDEEAEADNTGEDEDDDCRW